MLEALQGAIEFAKIVKEDPRIGWALAILLVAGALVAVLIGKARPDEPISIRRTRK